jgi:hypothetical protein
VTTIQEVISAPAPVRRKLAEARQTLGERERFFRSEVARRLLGSQEIDAALRRLKKQKRQLQATTCSAAWMEDCWEHGAAHAPQSPCHCKRCKGKRKFPAYYMYGDLSFECILEMRQPVDPDLAEALAPLMGSSPGVVVSRYALHNSRR